MFRVLLLLKHVLNMFFFPPCEVNTDVGLPTVDLSKCERGDITPDFQRFPKDTSNLFFAHLPGKPDDPEGETMQVSNTHIRTGCIVAEKDHQSCMPPSNLISTVISSAGMCAVTNALRGSNKTLHRVSSLSFLIKPPSMIRGRKKMIFLVYFTNRIQNTS